MSGKDIDPIWEIPDSWVWTRMGVIADVVGGSTPRTDDPTNWEPATIPWITPADLSGYTKKAISHGRRSISDKGLNTSGARLLPAGAVLFSSRAPIGYVAIAANPLATNQGFKSFVLNGGILPDYIYYYLVGNKHLALELAGGTTFAEISGKKAAEIPVCIPPVGEQVRIVRALEELFSKLDAAVTALERVRANLKRYRASVLKAACEGRLVPTEAELARREGRDYEPADVLLKRILKERRARWEAEELARLRAQGKEPKDDRWKRKYKEPQAPDTSGLPELPEGWVWASVEQLGEPVTGTTPSKAHPEYYGGSLPFVKPTDLDSGYSVTSAREFLSAAGAAQARVLPAYSVLVTCIGATIGKTGFARRECATNQQINAIIAAIEWPLPEYIYWYMTSPAGQQAVKENASATTLPILNKSKFAAIPVPLPPLAEQVRIVREIERQWSIIEALQATVELASSRSARLRQSILKRAFEGRLVPQDPSDEPASVLLERIRAERGSRASAGQGARGRGSTVPVPR